MSSLQEVSRIPIRPAMRVADEAIRAKTGVPASADGIVRRWCGPRV
ncbi:hypothetical protein PSP6_470004 [Paraburkholderia tropica]|nr:hypothetical protein PSP6_470004 [Paraburkholderia tropica]